MDALELLALRKEVSNIDLQRMKRVDRTPPSPHKGVISILSNPSECHIPIAEPILSPMSLSSDLDSFSVVSDIDAEGSQILQLTDDAEVSTSAEVPDAPTNASDSLTSLVQRFHFLCDAIGTLRDGISKQTESIKANALAKFELAKLRLETSRGMAGDVVDKMRTASNNKACVRLPWVPLEDGLVLLAHEYSTKISEKD